MTMQVQNGAKEKAKQVLRGYEAPPIESDVMKVAEAYAKNVSKTYTERRGFNHISLIPLDVMMRWGRPIWN